MLIVLAAGASGSAGSWSIPKGIPNQSESLEDAARRETLEEIGVTAPDELVSLGAVVYKNKKKRVYCFAGEVAETVRPYCASWETKDVGFFSPDEAREKLHMAQREFVGRLLAVLEC